MVQTVYNVQLELIANQVQTMTVRRALLEELPDNLALQAFPRVYVRIYIYTTICIHVTLALDKYKYMYMYIHLSICICMVKLSMCICTYNYLYIYQSPTQS